VEEVAGRREMVDVNVLLFGVSRNPSGQDRRGPNDLRCSSQNSETVPGRRAEFFSS
jgi:hypothetical protein